MNSGRKIITGIRKYWQILLFLVLLSALFIQVNFRPERLAVYLIQTAALFPAVLGGAVIFLSGSIDLSIGGFIALETSLFGLILLSGAPLSLAICLFVLSVIALGWLKAWLVTSIRADYEVLTLILQFLLIPVGGLIYVYTTGLSNREHSLAVFGPLILLGMILAGIFVWIFLNRTTWGKSLFILGRIRQISAGSGMDEVRLKKTAVLAGTLLAGMTAFNMMVRTGVPAFLDGNSISFQILAAISLIGSQSLTGVNCIHRSFIASGVIVMINAILQGSPLSTYAILTIYGVMILFSFWIRSLERRKN